MREDPDNILVLFRRIDIVKEPFRHMIQLLVCDPDEIHNCRTCIFKLPALIIIQKHRVRRIFHKKTEAERLPGIYEPELFEIDDDKG